MSGDQASKLKELEKNYEHVINENCRVFAKYFKEVLENSEENKLINPPHLVFNGMETKGNKQEGNEEWRIKKEEPGLHNGRYNVILLQLIFIFNLLK